MDYNYFLKNRKKYIFLRVVAFCLVFIYTLTNHVLPPVQAQTINFPTSFSFGLPENLSSVQTPEELGKVQEYFKGRGDRSVILIQDAHAIPDAQKNVHKLITYFQEKYGVRTVALEGASSKLDTSFFRSFPDKQRLKEIFKDYHEKGELTGGSAAALFSAQSRNGQAVHYHGIEDWKLYEEGLELYLEALNQQELIGQELRIRSQELERKKEAIYSNELLKIDGQLNSFYENQWTSSGSAGTC